MPVCWLEFMRELDPFPEVGKRLCKMVCTVGASVFCTSNTKTCCFLDASESSSSLTSFSN